VPSDPLPAIVQRLVADAETRGWSVTVDQDAVVLDCRCGGEHMYELCPATGSAYRDRNAREYLRCCTCWDEEAER
jgi:hypothetical protein